MARAQDPGAGQGGLESCQGCQAQHVIDSRELAKKTGRIFVPGTGWHSVAKAETRRKKITNAGDTGLKSQGVYGGM